MQFGGASLSASTAATPRYNAGQIVNQAVGAAAAIAIAILGTLIILKILDAVMGLRVNQQEELQGLDVSQHGEEGYIFL